ncbi:Guanosine-diphosphatase [Lecanicillium sp. MT-2017a]|nr:Guanosine-diphosphatase [Lecanicillium sp. MT-2017a]
MRTPLSSSTPPTPNDAANDPHEKPGRYKVNRKNQSVFAKMKETWMAQPQRTRYFKTVAIVFAVLCIFYWLSPTGVQVYNDSNKESVVRPVNPVSPPPAAPVVPPPKVDTPAKADPPAKVDTPAKADPPTVPAAGSNDGQVASDSSYGTDKCSKSYSKEKPIVQYVLMIDAGSTGSRIHVYKFNNCGAIPELESEEFKMTEKSVGGLSAYEDDPVGAAKSLDALMAVAMEHVPDSIKSCTPVAVKATAGLRRIGEKKAKVILDEVRRHLEEDYPFPVVSDDKGGVQIMDGSLEGVYAWITTNYLLDKIGGPAKGETSAIFDLGGGSTQIVFEPTFKGSDGGIPEKMPEGDHLYSLDYGGHKYELYQHSHLGYGLMAARETVHETLIADLIKSKGSDKSWMTEPIVHPCIAPGMDREVKVKVDGQPVAFNFTGPSRAAGPQCRNLAEKILNKEEKCGLAPCSFNGIYQPQLSKTFAKEEVFVFSFFYDRTKPLGMPDSFTLREMHDLTQAVCNGEQSWDMFSSIPDALTELRDRPEWCLDLNFMLALLHTGYEMPIDREVKIAKKIKGNELGWCLGASLPLLEANSGWKCRLSAA